MTGIRGSGPHWTEDSRSESSCILHAGNARRMHHEAQVLPSQHLGVTSCNADIELLHRMAELKTDNFTHSQHERRDMSLCRRFWYRVAFNFLPFSASITSGVNVLCSSKIVTSMIPDPVTETMLGLPGIQCTYEPLQQVAFGKLFTILLTLTLRSDQPLRLALLLLLPKIWSRNLTPFYRPAIHNSTQSTHRP